jgi:hypothetical protein
VRLAPAWPPSGRNQIVIPRRYKAFPFTSFTRSLLSFHSSRIADRTPSIPRTLLTDLLRHAGRFLFPSAHRGPFGKGALIRWLITTSLRSLFLPRLILSSFVAFDNYRHHCFQRGIAASILRLLPPSSRPPSLSATCLIYAANNACLWWIVEFLMDCQPQLRQGSVTQRGYHRPF